MYKDEDILDLYEDLLSIGAAETPEERSEKARKLLREKEFKTPDFNSFSLTQASNYLKLNEIPHNFYSVEWMSTDGEEMITNIILVNGFSVFIESIYSMVPNRIIDLEETFNLWLGIKSGNYYDDLNLLPEPGMKS